MQNALQAAVGRATRTIRKDSIPPVLKDGPLPAYRVAETLGKDINSTTMALTSLHRRGVIARVPYSDSASRHTRFAYCMPEHAEGAAKIVPIIRKRGRPAGKSGTKGDARAKGKTSFEVTFAFDLNGRQLKLTEQEARAMHKHLSGWFDRG